MGGSGVTLTGFDFLTKFLDNTPGEINRRGNKAVKKAAHLLKSTVLNHLDAQDLDHQDLTPEYASRKEKKGLSPDILRSTNDMYAAITTVSSGTLEATTGVKRSSGGDEGDIALYHEQIDPETMEDKPGDKMPARRVWKPSMKEIEGKVKTILSDVIPDALGVDI